MQKIYGKSRPTVEERFRFQREVDPLGRRIHVMMALLWCVLLGGPTTVVELAYAPLLVAFLIRLDKDIRTLRPVVTQPLFWLVVGYLAWLGLSLAWSPDRPLGVQEFGLARWAALILLLWPVMDRRDGLIAALAVGLLIGNGSQLAHAIGTRFDIPWLTFDRLPGRNSGWWDPVVGGSMLTAALGLHLPAALMGRGKARVLGILGAAITLVGILATGTRGAWVAATGLIGVTALIALVRIRPRRRAAAALAVAASVTIAAGIAAWLTVGPRLKQRFDAGVSEVNAALKDHQYNTDTGTRLLMWHSALDAMADHPIRGLGAGGFRTYFMKKVEDQQITLDPHRLHHGHAHSTYLHTGATLGIIGLALGAAVLLLGLRAGFRGPPDEGWGYGAGPAFALIGLLLAGVFDSIQVNAQTGAMLATLLALCWPNRPSAHWHPAANQGDDE